MSLSGEDFKKLQEAMLQAYPNKGDLEQMVRFYLDNNLDAIAGGNTIQEIIFKLIQRAEARGKLKDLLNAILKDRPDNLQLKTTVKELLKKYFVETLDDLRREDSYKRPDNLLKKSYILTLNGNIEDIDKTKLEAITEFLRQSINDLSLTIYKIEEGSIKLHLKGSEEGFNILKTLVDSGKLTEILGLFIEKIELTPSNRINMKPSKILHLSDLHFGTSAQAKVWAGQLVEDLQQNLKITQLDVLILSGDIANKSTSEEYQAAKEFLDEFIKDFPLKSEQIIIVPGNHDLNWDLSKKAYTLKDKDECKPDELQEGYYIPVNDDVVRIINAEKYLQRFTNFKDFYDNYKGSIKEYSLDAEQQYSLDIIGDNILILGLNSAWQLDHHYKTRATINNIALTNAFNEIRRNDTYENCPLKIAVWHHPINSPFEDRIKDSNFLQRLAVNNFNLFLHGHVHKAENDQFRYDLNVNGRKLHRICAGTFGAPTKELNTGIPWQYNLLKIESEKVIVHTRKREAENGAWEGDFRWRYGKTQANDHYEIEIQSINFFQAH